MMMGDEHVPFHEVEPSLDPTLPAASNKGKIIGYRICCQTQSGPLTRLASLYLASLMIVAAGR